MLTHINLRSGKKIIIILESEFASKTLNGRLKKKSNKHQYQCLCSSVITVFLRSLDSWLVNVRLRGWTWSRRRCDYYDTLRFEGLCWRLGYEKKQSGRTDDGQTTQGLVWFGAGRVKSGLVLCYDIGAAPPQVLVCFKWLLPLHLRGDGGGRLTSIAGCFCSVRIFFSFFFFPTTLGLLNKSSLTSIRTDCLCNYQLCLLLSPGWVETSGERHRFVQRPKSS